MIIGSLWLDMGAGEEDAGDLKVYYAGLSEGLAPIVDLLDADRRVIRSGQLRLVDLSAGTHIALVPSSAAPTPHRFVRLRGELLASFGVDAVDTVSLISQ